MVINPSFYEILVYSCEQSRFNSHVRDTVSRELCSFDAPAAIKEEQRRAMTSRLQRPVRYNDIVGAIELYALGTQIRADCWFSERSRIRTFSNQRHPVRWHGKLLERSYDVAQDSREIYADLLPALERAISLHKRLQRRFVDLASLRRCGPHLDWQALIRGGIRWV